MRMTRTCQDIIEIGRDLLIVKAKLGHGEWLPWLDAEFGMSAPTAERSIRAAQLAGTKSDTMSDLPPSILYALAAPSIPDAVREEVLAGAAQGVIASPTPSHVTVEN